MTLPYSFDSTRICRSVWRESSKYCWRATKSFINRRNNNNNWTWQIDGGRCTITRDKVWATRVKSQFEVINVFISFAHPNKNETTAVKSNDCIHWMCSKWYVWTKRNGRRTASNLKHLMTRAAHPSLMPSVLALKLFIIADRATNKTEQAIRLWGLPSVPAQLRLFDQSDDVKCVLRMRRPPVWVSRCVSIILIDSGFCLFYPFGSTGDNRTLKLSASKIISIFICFWKKILYFRCTSTQTPPLECNLSTNSLLFFVKKKSKLRFIWATSNGRHRVSAHGKRMQFTADVTNREQSFRFVSTKLSFLRMPHSRRAVKFAACVSFSALSHTQWPRTRVLWK